MEETINQFQTKLDQEIILKSEFNLKNNLSQEKIAELESSYHNLESNFQSAMSKCEAFSTERLQFSIFLNNLKKLLNMQGETNTSLLFNKVENILKLANDYTRLEKEKADLLLKNENEIDSHKEQIENKDIHLELLRKKIVDLEGGKFGKSELKIENENQMQTLKMQKVKIEKLNAKIKNLEDAMINLKCQILDINSLKVKLIILISLK